MTVQEELISDIKAALRDYRQGKILATHLARYVDNLVSHCDRCNPVLGPTKLPWEGNDMVENEQGVHCNV